LLDVVEGPHLGAEQVDDDVAGVDQHPVAMRQALDAGAAVALLLQHPERVVGHGADMPMRTARGDDQPVCDGALAFEIDEYDVLRLVVVETGQDQVFQGGDATLVVQGGLGRADVLLRSRRGFVVQRDSSFGSLAAPNLARPGARVSGVSQFRQAAGGRIRSRSAVEDWKLSGAVRKVQAGGARAASVRARSAERRARAWPSCWPRAWPPPPPAPRAGSASSRASGGSPPGCRRP